MYRSLPAEGSTTLEDGLVVARPMSMQLGCGATPGRVKVVPFTVTVSPAWVTRFVLVLPSDCRSAVMAAVPPFGRVKLHCSGAMLPDALEVSVMPVLAAVMISPGALVTGLAASKDPSRLPETSLANWSMTHCVVLAPSAR